MMYQTFIRPLLFALSPEKIHGLTFVGLKGYRHLGLLRRRLRCYHQVGDPLKYQTLHFPNRIGLSAGYDKEGEVFDELADLGFGFLEIGTVTPSPQAGNPSPRIFRLARDKSLLSRTGFNNPGVEVVLHRIRRYRTPGYVLGANINKDAVSSGDRAVKDFESVFDKLYPVVDYFTLNWGSVPETEMIQVLERITAIRSAQKESRSIFLKLPADIPTEGLDRALEVARHYALQGFIATGPTKDLSGLSRTSRRRLEQIGTGTVSGRGIGSKSLEVIRYLKSHLNSEMLIVGSGNVMTPEDALAMRTAGADLLEIYSALIDQGPEIVRKMNQKIQGLKIK